MQRERLPIYVNRFPGGGLTLTCAHCAVDAQIEGAEAIALYAEQRPSGAAIAWDSALTPEGVIAAAAAQCMHLAVYRTGPVEESGQSRTRRT